MSVIFIVRKFSSTIKIKLNELIEFHFIISNSLFEYFTLKILKNYFYVMITKFFSTSIFYYGLITPLISSFLFGSMSNLISQNVTHGFIAQITSVLQIHSDSSPKVIDFKGIKTLIMSTVSMSIIEWLSLLLSFYH